MIDFLKTLSISDYIDIITCLAEIGAVGYAAYAIRKSAKQQLFDERKKSYLIVKELLETYKYYMTKCIEYDAAYNHEPVALKTRYQWLTNSAKLLHIRNSIELNDFDKDRNEILSECERLEEVAESIGLLWRRGVGCWYAKHLRDFIRYYITLLQSIVQYEINTKRYDDTKTQIDSLQPCPERDSLMVKLAMYQNKKVLAEQEASNADDAMKDLYDNYINKRSFKRRKDNSNRPEEALIAMKDSIRL